MRTHIEPTTKENAVPRLFLRFFLCYLACALLALLVCYNQAHTPSTKHTDTLQCAFFAIAALSAFTTVSAPLLSATTACKAVFDVGSLTFSFAHQSKAAMLRSANITFVRLACGALLFCAVAANAQFFSHTNYKRNTELLFSRECLTFFIRTALFLACALFLHLLSQQLTLKFC